MILFFFISTHLSVHSMGSLTSSVGTFSSGYTLHHFQMQNSDEENLRWMFHLINTRTGETDRILFGRIATVYGVNRRMLFGTSWNRDVFYDLASRCKSPEELRDLLHVMNVRHILMASAFKQNVINSMAPNLPSPETMSMIDQVLERFASLRAVSPDGSMLLYSMKDSLNMDPFVFDERDAEAFPIMYLQSANNETNKGNYSVSLRMLEKFLHIRTRSQNLSYAYGMMIALYALVKNEDKVEELIRNIETLPFQLSYIGYNEVGNVYYHAGRLPLAFEFYAKALKNNPKFYVAFNNLGNIYMANGQNDKAIEYFTDSISLNPTYEIAYYNLYNLYANMGEKEKAQQTLDNLNALKQALR